MFMQFWPILGLYDPVKGPLHYQQSTLKGPYSPKSLHKFILSENGFTFIFFEVKMLLGSPKVDAGGGAKYSKLWPKKVYEIRKSASNTTIFGVKLCFDMFLFSVN